MSDEKLLTIFGTILYILFLILYVFTFTIIYGTMNNILWWTLFIIFGLASAGFGAILIKYFILKIKEIFNKK